MPCVFIGTNFGRHLNHPAEYLSLTFLGRSLIDVLTIQMTSIFV